MSQPTNRLVLRRGLLALFIIVSVLIAQTRALLLVVSLASPRTVNKSPIGAWQSRFRISVEHEHEHHGPRTTGSRASSSAFELSYSREFNESTTAVLQSTNANANSTIALVTGDATLIPLQGEGPATTTSATASNTTITIGIKQETESEPETIAGSKRERFLKMIPTNDELDKIILKTAIPSMINLAVIPLVNSVDTFWVGRMGIALALAGQAAANQAFFTIFFLVNYLPTITAPLVASAVGSGDLELAQKRVGESLFLSNLLGGLGSLFLVAFPSVGLSLLLSDGAPALDYARPYLRLRAISMVPALVGATGFAAFRGSLDTMTPLKVSLFTKYVLISFCTTFHYTP